MLNDQEKNKFTIIKKLENGEITRKEAADELKISLRQVDRLRINYRNYGEKGFIHKNKGKIPVNKLNRNLIDKASSKNAALLSSSLSLAGYLVSKE